MRYPKECPVFEVTVQGTHVNAGAIVEGLGPALHQAFEGHRAPDPGYTRFISVRVLDRVDWCCFDERYNGLCRKIAGFLGCCIGVNDLRPLTPAAVDMMALVARD